MGIWKLLLYYLSQEKALLLANISLYLWLKLTSSTYIVVNSYEWTDTG